MSEENETSRSIFGRTESVFTAPELNEGVPDDSRFLQVLSKVEIAIGVALFALVFLGVMYQVLGRYVPAINWTGAGELALLAMITLTFVTTGYLVGRNGHIVILVWDQLLAGRKLFVALRVISAVIMVATCLALGYESVVKIAAETRLTPAMQIPVGLQYVFALIGFLSGAIHSVGKIVYANRPERQLEISQMEA